MNVIALITDFGQQDGYPGIMKGVIAGIDPDAKCIDLTHDILPQDIFGGAKALSRSWVYFPAGTIFCCVVDPGVGTDRKPIALFLGDRYYVGPDNGLFSFVMENSQIKKEICSGVLLDDPKWWLPKISNSFHGRDIFAPICAHISRGVSIHSLGSSISNINDLIRISIPKPQIDLDSIKGKVIHIDRFGNMATNIRAENMPIGLPVVQIRGFSIKNINKTFGTAKPSEMIMLFDSEGWMTICMVNGNAADSLECELFEPVILTSIKE